MGLASYALLVGLTLLAVTSVGASLNILMRGALYRRLKPRSRPRRWVLLVLLVMFGAFAVWFPVWMLWPHSIIAKALTLVFGVVFGLGGLMLRWFGGLVDMLYERKGWQLR